MHLPLPHFLFDLGLSKNVNSCSHSRDGFDKVQVSQKFEKILGKEFACMPPCIPPPTTSNFLVLYFKCIFGLVDSACFPCSTNNISIASKIQKNDMASKVQMIFIHLNWCYLFL